VVVAEAVQPEDGLAVVEAVVVAAVMLQALNLLL